jgi:hypothetical protein
MKNLEKIELLELTSQIALNALVKPGELKTIDTVILSIYGDEIDITSVLSSYQIEALEETINDGNEENYNTLEDVDIEDDDADINYIFNDY